MGAPRTGPLGSLERQRRRRGQRGLSLAAAVRRRPGALVCVLTLRTRWRGEPVFRGSELPCDQLASPCWEVAAGLCAWALPPICEGWAHLDLK